MQRRSGFFVTFGCLILSVLFVAVLLAFLQRENPLEAALDEVHTNFGDVTFVDPEALEKVQPGALQLFDVRSGEEFAFSAIPSADHLGPALRGADLRERVPKDTPVVFYCSLGGRAAQRAEELAIFGYDNISVLTGGIFMWANSGRPLVKASGEDTLRVHPYNKTYGMMLKPRVRGTLPRQRVPVSLQAGLFHGFRIGSAAFVLILMLAWESLSPFMPIFVAWARVRHGLRNYILGSLNVLLIAAVFLPAWWVLANLADAAGFGLLNVLRLDGLAHALIAFLLLDLWTYSWHRLNHAVPVLWRFHRVHHSDPVLDVTSATRFHPGEILFSSILRMPLIPLLGCSLEAFVVYEATMFAVVQFHHANIQLPAAVDRVLRTVIVTPAMHRIHHSPERIRSDSNFSSLLSVWDRLFGTWTPIVDGETIAYGSPPIDGAAFQSLKGMLATPFLTPKAPAQSNGPSLASTER